jgi:hypothetical protein
MPELATLSQPTPRQRNWAAWIGLLLAFAAMLSNAGFLLGVPWPKLLAWLVVVLTIAAVVCAVIGIMRAFRQPQVYAGKVSSSILGVLALLICGLAAVASISSRALPAATNAPQVGQKAPDFTLPDTHGIELSLGMLLGKEHKTFVAMPSQIMELTKAGKLPPATASPATPTKAVLLVFYRGYW